jgi:uncharacterized protein YxjI
MFQQHNSERQGERSPERAQGRVTVDGGDLATRYLMPLHVASSGDDIAIQNDRGERAYKIEGRALHLRHVLLFEDIHGRELAKIARVQDLTQRFKDTLCIEGPHGEILATVKKTCLTPSGVFWSLTIGRGPDMEIQGNLLAHEYQILSGAHTVVQVSRHSAQQPDSYGVEIESGQNYAVFLAATIAVDIMAHQAR